VTKRLLFRGVFVDWMRVADIDMWWDPVGLGTRKLAECLE